MSLEQQYDELCKTRDDVNAKNAPLEAELAKFNALAEQARLAAVKVAEQIDANRGGAAWLELKRTIRILAPGIEQRRAAAA